MPQPGASFTCMSLLAPFAGITRIRFTGLISASPAAKHPGTTRLHSQGRVMSTDLVQLEELITDPGRVSEWRRCVVTIDGRKVTAGPVALRGGAAVKLVGAEGRHERTTPVAMGDWPARAAARPGGAGRP